MHASLEQGLKDQLPELVNGKSCKLIMYLHGTREEGSSQFTTYFSHVVSVI